MREMQTIKQHVRFICIRAAMRMYWKEERARASWASERIWFVDKSDQTDYRSGECNRVKVDVYIQRLCLRTFHILVGCESRRNSNQSNSKLQTRSMNCFYTWNIDFWYAFSLLNLVNSIKFHQYQTNSI